MTFSPFLDDSMMVLMLVCLQLGAIALGGASAQENGFCLNNLIPPALCASDQQKCVKDLDEFGCPSGKFCFPKATPSNCTLSCPKTCKATEMFCKGVPTTTPGGSGCDSPHVCIPRIDKATGCPNHCPPQCKDGQMVCMGRREECCGARNECCTPAPTCVPIDEDCPIQLFDSSGCPDLQQAGPETLCAGPNEKLCPKGEDRNGCPRPKYCYRWDSDKSPHLECKVNCPATCNLLFERPCPPTYDIHGCEEEPVCTRFEEQCPPNQHEKNTGCPIIQPETECSDTQIECMADPVYKKELTTINPQALLNPTAICYPRSTCKSDTVKGVRTKCPAFCPPNCREEHMVGTAIELRRTYPCPALYDNKGCLQKVVCREKADDCGKQSFDERGCRIWEKLLCKDNQKPCEPLIDQLGCEEKPFCLPDEPYCECPKPTNDKDGCPILTDDDFDDCALDEMECKKGENTTTIYIPTTYIHVKSDDTFFQSLMALIAKRGRVACPCLNLLVVLERAPLFVNREWSAVTSPARTRVVCRSPRVLPLSTQRVAPPTAGQCAGRGRNIATSMTTEAVLSTQRA